VDLTRTALRPRWTWATARALLASLGCVLVALVFASEREPIVQTVDLLVPLAPATVRIAGKTHVVHELHITNVLAVDVSIVRIQILRVEPPDVSIADYRDDEVRKRIGRPGLRRDIANPQVVGPGMRAVAYLWIELADESKTPAALRHRIELDVLRETGPVRVLVEGGSTLLVSKAPVSLSPPLRGGPWTAIYDPLMLGGHRTALYALDGRARIPGRFAIDWIRLREGRAIDDEYAGADWNGLGAEVLAVADATVAAASDDIPDNSRSAAWPGASQLENASGNYVALDLGRGRFAFYEHLMQGSVAVKAGDRVRTGQVIGRLGNSGSSSMGPHLHFHVSDANSLLGAEGLPFVFTRFDELGAFASIDALIGGEKWLPNHGNQASARRLERPRPNAVIQFL
jgi:Peptidase family M23